MFLYLKVALRYLISVRSKALSFMSIISILGIIVGVSALLITLSVMSGFLYGIKEKLLQTSPHIVIMKIGGNFDNYNKIQEEFLSKIPDIIDFEPFIYSNALASKENYVIPVIVRGVEPEKDKRVMETDRKLISGDFDLIKNDNSIIIGKDVATSLGVWVGDTVNIISPFGKKTPIGIVPKMKKFYIVGIISFGLYEVDSTFVEMNLKTSQKFFDMKNSITGIQVKVTDPYNVEIVKEKLTQILPPNYIIKTWIDMNKSLFQALQLEKLGMFLVIALIILVASFNISSLLVTKAREKRKDIAILKTIGADSNFILKVFLWQGIIIGITGAIIGTIIGLAVIHFVDTYHLIKLNPEVYPIEYLPLKISFTDTIIVFVSTLIICFISSVFPSYVASKEIPANVLRYE